MYVMHEFYENQKNVFKSVAWDFKIGMYLELGVQYCIHYTYFFSRCVNLISNNCLLWVEEMKTRVFKKYFRRGEGGRSTKQWDI
jgi:hypothetical protein